jgi:hypothetical protein
MTTDFPEPDWRAFRKLREVALERFCERILIEVDRHCSDAKETCHARYLTVYNLIQERDDQIARAFNNPRRSSALSQLAEMQSLGLIQADELRTFTPQTRRVLEALQQPLRRARATKGA